MRDLLDHQRGGGGSSEDTLSERRLGVFAFTARASWSEESATAGFPHNSSGARLAVLKVFCDRLRGLARADVLPVDLGHLSEELVCEHASLPVIRPSPVIGQDGGPSCTHLLKTLAGS